MGSPADTSETPLRRALRANPALAGFLGLACLRVWLQVCLYDTYTLSDGGLVTIASNFSYSAVLLGGALWAIVCRPALRARSAVPWIAFFLMTFASAGLLVAKSSGGEGPLLVASIVAGAAAAFGGGTCALSYSWLGLREAAFFSFASLGLGSLAGFLLGFLPSFTQLCVAMLMPACLLVCHRIALGAVAQGAPKASDLWFDCEPVSTPVVLLGGVALVAFALGITRGYPLGEPVAMTVGMRALHQLGVVAVSAWVVRRVLTRPRVPSASLLWGVDIVLIALGILLASALPSQYVGYGVAVANLGDTLSLGIIWLLAQDYARHTSLHPFAVVGLAWFARIFFRNVGRVLMPLVAPVIVGVDVLAGVVVLALAGAMAVLLSGAVPRGRCLLANAGGETRGGAGSVDVAAGAEEPQAVGGAAISGTVDTLAARTKLLCEAFALTQREAQVCALIASGRNKTAVAEYLSLSENTVRTHSKNAYAKLGVHTKEELVELIERAAQGRQRD